MPITVSKTHRCSATRSGNVFRSYLNFNSGLNTHGTRSRRCEFQFRRTIYRSLREEPPFEDTRVSDNLIAKLDCRRSSPPSRGAGTTRPHKFALEPPRPFARACSSAFSNRTSSLQKEHKDSCFSFSRRGDCKKKERIAPLIRNAKTFSERGRRGFVSRLRNRRAVYAKFPFRRVRRFQFAVHYTLTRLVHVGCCRENQSHHDSLTRMIYGYVVRKKRVNNL